MLGRAWRRASETGFGAGDGRAVQGLGLKASDPSRGGFLLPGSPRPLRGFVEGAIRVTMIKALGEARYVHHTERIKKLKAKLAKVSIENFKLRRAFHSLVHSMICSLDDLEGDPDLEPEEDMGIDDRPHDDIERYS